jgi:glucose/arabinose dehydrogenase
MIKFSVLAGLASFFSIFVIGDAAAQVSTQVPGTRHHVRPADMPLPFATPSSANPSRSVPIEPGITPVVLSGYKVNLFSDQPRHARWMTVAPSGEVFLAETGTGRISVLVDKDGDGVAEQYSVFAEDHSRPHGLAIVGDHLYVADTSRVWRYAWRAGQTRASDMPEAVTKRGELGSGFGHSTRTLLFDADASHFYVAIGSFANVARENAPRATVMRFKADGTEAEVFASGLRNPVGLAAHPITGALVTVVNERDGMGDELVPDYLAVLKEGGFYGWPYAYIGSNPMPGFAEIRLDLVERAIVPDVLFRSHTAPLGLVFGAGGQFPESWQDDAFVALHGSWNADKPRGYKVVRVPFEDGKPLGWYEDFVVGFWVGHGDGGPFDRGAKVIGRPAGLAIARDGSMLIADDVANVIWRVSRQ